MPGPLPALLASLGGALCLYLAAPRQQWLARPLPARSGRLAGSLLLVVAWLLWQRLMDGTAAFFALLALLMLLFAVLPALSLLKRSKA